MTDTLREALALAANRLLRCAVNFPTGSPEFASASEWAEEARAALAAAPQPAQNEGGAHAEDTSVPGGLRPLMGDGSGVVGDRRVLIEQARALLAINASGNAVPRMPNLAVSIIERLVAALAAAPQPATEDDYHNDPSADDRWNAGCDYAMTALCKLLRINTDDVTWDAATEELEGDVLAVLGNILTVRFGDDWRRAEPQPAVADREACRAKQAEPDRGSDETPYDRGYVWGYRHGLRDGKAEVAPQPATEDRGKGEKS